jgi:hypothetical protein
MGESNYSEDSIRSLDWKEHIRLRPGMYIGKLGDGSAYDDGIYVLLKEIIDNSIDEFVMGGGKSIEITVSDKKVSIRDYGRGIPLGKVIDCVYPNKVLLSDISNLINSLDNHKVDIRVENLSKSLSYVGNGTTLEDLKLELVGLEKGIQNTYIALKK